MRPNRSPSRLLPGARRAQARRGAALLVVLAVLLLVSAAAVAVAHSAATEVARRNADRDQALADDLADAALAPIQSWLNESSGTAVLPSGAETAMFAIIDERVQTPATDSSSPPAQFDPTGGDSPRLVVSAWDQLAMVPWSLASRSGRIATLLPGDVVETISAIETHRDVPLGLDLIPPPTEGARSIFPRSDSRGPQSGPVIGETSTKGSSSHPAVGELVSTHAAPVGGDTASTRAALRLNVNTTPRALLEAAAESAQVSLPDTLWTSRGKSKPYRDAIPGGASADLGGTIAFVSSSDCWSFRIDAFAGGARSSWWLVMRRGERGWEAAQRIPIVTEPFE